ncbi:BACON domain-containing protein [Bacteroides salyersiae]|uniref:BACON domain-containing protein n=1 Tax=Bacteroides salyersiae TaxID=291644 RepID=UPI0034A1D13D
MTVTGTGTVKASSSESWCTTTVSSKVVTVKVDANNGAEEREAYVTIQAGEKAGVVKVIQAGTSI